MDLLFCWINSKSSLQVGLGLIVLFQIHKGLCDAIQCLETIWLDVENFLTLVNAGSIFVEFQVAERKVLVRGNLHFLNDLFHLIFRANEFDRFVKFGNDVGVVNSGLCKLFALEMLAGCGLESVQGFDFRGLHEARLGVVMILVYKELVSKSLI